MTTKIDFALKSIADPDAMSRLLQSVYQPRAVDQALVAGLEMSHWHATQVSRPPSLETASDACALLLERLGLRTEIDTLIVAPNPTGASSKAGTIIARRKLSELMTEWNCEGVVFSDPDSTDVWPFALGRVPSSSAAIVLRRQRQGGRDMLVLVGKGDAPGGWLAETVTHRMPPLDVLAVARGLKSSGRLLVLQHDAPCERELAVTLLGRPESLVRLPPGRDVLSLDV
jgi:hypothetical protein